MTSLTRSWPFLGRTPLWEGLWLSMLTRMTLDRYTLFSLKVPWYDLLFVGWAWAIQGNRKRWRSVSMWSDWLGQVGLIRHALIVTRRFSHHPSLKEEFSGVFINLFPQLCHHPLLLSAQFQWQWSTVGVKWCPNAEQHLPQLPPTIQQPTALYSQFLNYIQDFGTFNCNCCSYLAINKWTTFDGVFGLNISRTKESSDRWISKQDLLYSGQIDMRCKSFEISSSSQGVLPHPPPPQQTEVPIKCRI